MFLQSEVLTFPQRLPTLAIEVSAPNMLRFHHEKPDTEAHACWLDCMLRWQAVRSGLWLVFENIDAAPFELLSSLTPLLEDRCLHLPGWGEVRAWLPVPA